MRMQSRTQILRYLVVLALAPGWAGLAAAAQPYAVEERFALEGAGRWDYLAVDPVRHRLFVTRGDHVDVVDSRSGAALGSIAATEGVHGVAFAPALGRGFTSNGRSDTVTVFDLESLKTIGTIKVTGSNPDGLLYHAKSRRLFVFNGKTANATVIDAGTGSVAQTIALQGKPEVAAATDSRIFVTIEDKALIEVLDAATGGRVASWPLPGCRSPTGLAFDAERRRLFSACENRRMVVTNADTGAHVATVEIGEGPDGAEFDPASRNVFVSNGKSATLTVVHQSDADHYAVIASLPTEKGARTIAFDPSRRRVYLPTVVAGKFTVLVVAESGAPAADPDRGAAQPK